jgi:mannosyl-3-phosphoglycerate phosphatase
MNKPYIIFSDLDGTLLDYHTYSFESAIPVLTQIKNENIPLILVSSKTRRELILYQEKLGLKEFPFVVENGSAIYTPIGYFASLRNCEIFGDNDRYTLGNTFNEIEKILLEISEKHGYHIRGFHNASRGEVEKMTNLSGDELQMALAREFSIPLFFDTVAEQILDKEIDNYDLQLLYGGRFMHLLSKVDKGDALNIVMDGYRERLGRNDLQSIAIGDSLNDFAMLDAADHAILVKKHDGSYERRQTLQHVTFSPGIGPDGWNRSLRKYVQSGGSDE